MATEKTHFVLTDEEYNLLNDISRKTRADCWFTLHEDEKGGDCVYDLENGELTPLDLALQQLNEAIIPDLINLTNEEIKIYTALLNKLNINDNPFEQVLVL